VSDHTDYDAIVLAGGAARRLGGADKPALSVGGRPLLDRVLAACPDAAVTVVVGPGRPTRRAVVPALEDPPGGGPLAALDAGLRHTTAPTVLVLSADLPFLTRAAVRALLEAATTTPAAEGAAARREAAAPHEAAVAPHDAETSSGPAAPGPAAPGPAAPGPAVSPGPAASRSGDAAPSRDAATPRHGDVPPCAAPPGEAAVARDAAVSREGAVLRDGEGRDQPLVAAYRVEPLRRELARLRAAHGTLAGLPLRALLAGLALVRVQDATATASFDCDTWADIGAARARIREHGNVLDEWITAVKAELGIELDVDTAALLDLARDAAHGVARPAAPLTTFLIGYAAGRQGGDVAELAQKAAALANRWAAENADGGDGAGGAKTDGAAGAGGGTGAEAKPAE
jgi:molybdopterin-guanine dinucleotide biosynthesis protein A